MPHRNKNRPAGYTREFQDDEELDFAADNRAWNVRKKTIINPIRSVNNTIKRKIKEIVKSKQRRR